MKIKLNRLMDVLSYGQHNGSSFRCMPEHTEIRMYERLNGQTHECTDVLT
ncbi:hypothetical protein [Bacteroides acidifaciens]|nr:hypothetical protein [Bacteroides acidifaciens]